MRKLVSLILCAVLLCTSIAFAEPQTLTGKGKGFVGAIEVEVIVDGSDIVEVKVVANSETAAIAGPALEQIPAAIAAADSADVDVVTNATYTSKGIMAAVKNAIDPENNPYEEPVAQEAAKAEAVAAAEATIGFGIANAGRVGPGKDDTGVQVWSFNQVFANVIFDKEGRILYADVDQLEVATPNYDGATMPHFSGFPGQSYNIDSDHDEKVDGTVTVTEESFMAEIATWQTKRERGAGYVMGTGTWDKQMDRFEELFVGKTVEEINEWFAKYTASNGRPLKAGSTNEADAAKYDALTDDEKAMLADVTTTATMSLNDSHGNILAALEAAYANRRPLNVSAAAIGTGFEFGGRLGPGKDDTGVGVYSINEIYAVTLFDAEGKIVDVYMDQLEIATPNYDGATMPHFTGVPGTSYNLDANHDEKVDGTETVTEESFMAQIESWQTKRERGAGYVMGTGTWDKQMDRFQELFIGKTVEEINEWFTKYTASNGRPLKAGSSNEADAAKYDALTDDEKAMLADVTTTATMSLNDSHGNLLAALEDSFAKKVEVELTIGK